MSNFTAAFKVTGIYPVNREVFLLPREETSLTKRVVWHLSHSAAQHPNIPLTHKRRRMTSQRRKLSSSTGDIRMTMISVTPGTICGLLHILTHLFTSECGYNLCRPLQSASFCSVSCLQLSNLNLVAESWQVPRTLHWWRKRKEPRRRRKELKRKLERKGKQLRQRKKLKRKSYSEEEIGQRSEDSHEDPSRCETNMHVRIVYYDW